MNYGSEEEYNDDMANEAMAQAEAEAIAAEGEAEEERLRLEWIGEEVKVLEEKIDYHERIIAEYRTQIQNLTGK